MSKYKEIVAVVGFDFKIDCLEFKLSELQTLKMFYDETKVQFINASTSTDFFDGRLTKFGKLVFKALEKSLCTTICFYHPLRENSFHVVAVGIVENNKKQFKDCHENR